MDKQSLSRKFTTPNVGCLVALGIFVAVLVGAGALIRLLWLRLMELIHTVSTMDTVIIIALISGMVTVMGLIANSVISMRLKKSEFKYKRKAMLLRKLEAPYTQFVNMLFDMVEKKDDAGKIDEAVRSQLIREMSREIILYGSDEIVKKWAEYKKKAPDFTLEEHLLHIEKLLHLIREDMGIEQGDLTRGELLSLFVDDIGNYADGYQIKIGKHSFSWKSNKKNDKQPTKN
ncbi:MAG: hypothetical protein FWC92_06405 [Defluviitaleaceae bacterium]|nr:hypothetical protein [Defluviitaleaceae bacterium]